MRRCTTSLVVWLALMAWLAGALPASSATRHVVMLFDERLELPGLAALEAELVRTLAANSPDRIETYRETMDLSRFGSDPHETLLKDYLRAKYANKKIDVAVAAFGPALDFLLKHGDAIFPGTPIVFCGLDRRELGDRALPPRVRGVLLKREFAPTLELALRLHPDTKRVAVIAGTSEFDTRLLAQARQEFGVYESRLAFTYLTTLPLQKLLAELARLPPQTIVLFTTLFQDGAGASFVPHDVIPLVSAAGSAPVYGFLDQYLGRGIVGGSLYSTSAQGSEAAKLVLQVLANSERSGPSLLEVSGSKALFDWRQMQRWGISASSLPAGSEIRFRDSTAWQQYRWQIVSIAVVLMLETMLIVGLLYQRRRRHSAEVEARQRMAELAHMNRYATAGELSASIAHEVNQPLGSILCNTETAELMLDSAAPDLEKIKELLADIKRDDQRASEVVRRLRRLLAKAERDAQDIDLNEAVGEVLKLVSVQAAASNVALNSVLAPQAPQVSGDRIQLQQVILNLVVNGMESMAATSNGRREITSRTEISDRNTAELSISDSGPGIPPEKLGHVFEPFYTTKEQGMGMGLSIARTIVESHGGRIWAENGIGGGAVFRLSLPLTKAH